MADVVVTVTSPELEGERLVVSDAQGRYRVPDLPPGLYTLRFEVKDFRPHERKDIHLRLNRTVRVNIEMFPMTMDEAAVAAATAPTIDPCQFKSCDPVGAEFIKRIALPRSQHLPRSHVQTSELAESTRSFTPSWMLSRLPVLVPDGTPQLVYRAPSAKQGSPDFGR